MVGFKHLIANFHLELTKPQPTTDQSYSEFSQRKGGGILSSTTTICHLLYNKTPFINKILYSLPFPAQRPTASLAEGSVTPVFSWAILYFMSVP